MYIPFPGMIDRPGSNLDEPPDDQSKFLATLETLASQDLILISDTIASYSPDARPIRWSGRTSPPTAESRCVSKTAKTSLIDVWLACPIWKSYGFGYFGIAPEVFSGRIRPEKVFWVLSARLEALFRLESLSDSPQEADMQTLDTKNKIYLLDDDGFLVNPAEWDENFAEGMAQRLGITNGLTSSHWDVLRFIRATYLETGSCPIVYKTCRANKLSVQDLQRLFPFGYQRGACKLAGLSFMIAVLERAELDFRREASKLAGFAGVSTPFYPKPETPIGPIPIDKRVYRVDVQGFLIDPNEWDEDFAIFKARELQMVGPLGEKHWQIIRYIRSEFEKKDEIPTVYATCEAVGIGMDELEKLFPSGYHRGAVKITGLNLAAKRH